MLGSFPNCSIEFQICVTEIPEHTILWTTLIRVLIISCSNVPSDWSVIHTAPRLNPKLQGLHPTILATSESNRVSLLICYSQHSVVNEAPRLNPKLQGLHRTILAISEINRVSLLIGYAQHSVGSEAPCLNPKLQRAVSYTFYEFQQIWHNLLI